MNCPICNNEGFEEGERVDVGWGSGSYGVKAGPDHCQICFYVEAEITFEHFQKCWELMIYPHPPTPNCQIAEFDKKYQEFFLKQEAAYGNCHFQCLKLVEAFPELRIVYGFYVDWIWGEREHFWCVDCQDKIVDPTQSQFPTNSNIYMAKRYIHVDELKSKLEITNCDSQRSFQRYNIMVESQSIPFFREG